MQIAHDASHAALIDALGGASEVARMLARRLGGKGPSRAAVSAWKRRGVARDLRLLVAEEARRRGIEVPADFLAPKWPSRGEPRETPWRAQP